MRHFPLLLVLFSVATGLLADDRVRTETRVEEARAWFGVTGKQVIIAVIDRGIHYEHPDFRNEDGTFHAWLNPSTIFSAPSTGFTSFVTPGYTVWDMASGNENIAPNSYVLRDSWTDVDGFTRSFVGNDVGPGALWSGSGVGPTYDGRIGVTLSAPGNSNITAYAPRPFFATVRENLVVDGEAPYGMLGAVSGAAPVVTGIIALLLEADPTMDAARVKDILQRTARQDEFTGETPNTVWGYRKIDAFAAVAEVLNVTSVERLDTEVPARPAVLGNYPNPFARQSRIRFAVPLPGRSRLTVYDVLGREIERLVDQTLEPGTYEVVFDAAGLPAGPYVYRLEAAGRRVTGVMTVVR